MDRGDVHDFISKMRKLMIKELDKDVIEELFNSGHLTVDEYNYILSHESREKKIVCFLDKLTAKTKASNNAFMEHLQEWYDYILTDYRNGFNNDDSNVNQIRYLLSEAEVPSLPQKHVSRTDELIKLIDYLHDIKRGEYVVVHGMGGCGKSTLVIEALRHSSSLVLDTFNRKIFWLMVGRESSVKKEALNEAKVKELTIQQELYTKLFTSGGYSSPPLPRDNDEGKRLLKEKLSEPEFEDCLLILDDVPSSNFIECLNVGCKILVTTDNKNIMNSIKSTHTIQFLKVGEGFTEKESMTLFSKNLETNARLPIQAKHIHALCKGFPLTISLVASQLAEYKDDVLTNNDLWDVYVEHLKNKDIEAAIGRYDEYRQEQITLLYKALAMSINSLTPELRDLYQDFALFMDDVNIKPEVLTTLWKVNKKEVEDIMNEFEKKCLVIRTWNGQLSSYVYCVHDLLLDYLKRRLTGIELQALHRKLIARYQEKFGQNFIQFPRSDNYIFLYLGYHLREAGHLEEFPKLYFNLTFIEKKILIHGAADVLYDFKKYKDYITNTEENTKKYEEFYNFINRIGICRVLSSSDIVQFALSERKESYVYKMGVNLANNSDKKYFEYLTEVPKDCSYPDVHPMRGEKITAAIFTSDGNIILANANNLIKVIDIKTHDTIHTFEGHNEKINHLVLSNLKIMFLSASEGSSVKVWNLNSDVSYAGEKPRTPSPSLTQKAWKDNWAQQRISAEKPLVVLDKHSLPITDAKFSSKTLSIVTASKDKTVIMWQLGLHKNGPDLLFRPIPKIISVSDVVVSCCFNEEETYVICATQNKVVWIYNRASGDVYAYYKVDFMINSVAVVSVMSGIEVILLGDNYKALLYEKSPKKLDLKNEGLQYHTLSRRRQDECICAAVSNDGKYIALAPTFYCIVVKEVKTDLEVAKFHETNGKISGISWSYDSKSIMTTYENALFKVWNLPKAMDNKIIKLKASVFDATWIIKDEDYDDPDDRLLVTAVLDTECNINIFHDLQFFKKISKSDICQLCVCPVNGHVIYACKNGTIGVIDFEDDSSNVIRKVECYKVLKLRVFSNSTTTSTLLLVEKTPKKFKLIGWYNDVSSGDSDYLGTEIVYVEEDDSIIDFNVDLERTGSVYVAKKDHTFHIFDLRNGEDLGANNSSDTSSEDDDDSVESNEVKFAEFSPSFEYMGSVNESGVLVTTLSNDKKCVIKFDNTSISPTVIKFSHDDEFIAVGFAVKFACGVVRVYDTKTKKDMEFQTTSSVFDLTWSSHDNRLLVILDREIALYDVSSKGCSLISIIYLSVDKVLINDSFSQIVTVDYGGHFHVLKHPL